MTLRDALLDRVGDVEARLASCVERAELGDYEQLRSAIAFAAVAVALREVVAALEEVDGPRT